MFKSKEILEKLDNIDKKLANILALLKSDKIKKAQKGDNK